MAKERWVANRKFCDISRHILDIDRSSVIGAISPSRRPQRCSSTCAGTPTKNRSFVMSQAAEKLLPLQEHSLSISELITVISHSNAPTVASVSRSRPTCQNISELTQVIVHTCAQRKGVVSALHDLISLLDMELFTEKRSSQITRTKSTTRRKRSIRSQRFSRKLRC